MPEVTITPETLALRELISACRDEFQVLLGRYGATDPKLFGSVARGTASVKSDIDILVEMNPADGNILMRASGVLDKTRAFSGGDHGCPPTDRLAADPGLPQHPRHPRPPVLQGSY